MDLCREATDWEGRLADLAHEIRCRVQEAEVVPEPDPVADEKPTPTRDPAAILHRPLADDVREADRGAHRLADHHPEPEARRLYRQLVEHVESKRAGRS